MDNQFPTPVKELPGTLKLMATPLRKDLTCLYHRSFPLVLSWSPWHLQPELMVWAIIWSRVLTLWDAPSSTASSRLTCLLLLFTTPLDNLVKRPRSRHKSMSITHTFAPAIKMLPRSLNTWAAAQVQPKISRVAHERSVDDKSLTHLLRTNEPLRKKTEAESCYFCWNRAICQLDLSPCSLLRQTCLPVANILSHAK